MFCLGNGQGPRFGHLRTRLDIFGRSLRHSVTFFNNEYLMWGMFSVGAERLYEKTN
jgi:hypothetical protein